MLYFFLAAVTPLWILDLALRALGASPPAWLGDAMALSLMGVVVGIARYAWIGHRIRRRTYRVQQNAPESAPPKPESFPCLVHEIRNYSSALKANVQLLRSRMGEAPGLEPLGRLERTTEKIERMALEILESANLSGIAEPEGFCLGSVVETCVADHFPDRCEAFRIECEADLPAVSGDARKLERVFLNLFRNAFEAGAGTLRIRLIAVPNRVRVLVEDDGRGCPPEALARLFRPLYTTKKHQGGSGLGLYLAKTTLEAHGGTIRAVSKNAWGEGQTGLVFCLELPIPGKCGARRKAVAGKARALAATGG